MEHKTEIKAGAGMQIVTANILRVPEGNMDRLLHVVYGFLAPGSLTSLGGLCAFF